MIAAAVGLVFVSLGAATAAAKVGGNKVTTTASSSSTDSTTVSTTKPHPFGQTISSLRHAGDFTPAAVIMGKKVPGYYATTTATTEVTQPDPEPTGTSEAKVASPKVSRGNGEGKVPAAVLKGKKVPGQSK